MARNCGIYWTAMKSLRAFEAALLRVEGTVAVALVVLMLALAGYNVVYRNVLVPMQRHWAHSGPKPAAAEPDATPAATPTPTAAGAAASPGTPPPDKSAAEGFAGDWGEGGEIDAPADDEPEAKAAAAKAAEAKAAEAKDDAGDFGGDWGEDDGAAAAPADPGAAEGFAGDWGEGGDAKAPADRADAKPDEGGDDFGDEAESDPFANLPDIDAKGGPAAAPIDPDEGGPPPAGSFAANMVAFIDAIKLDWIDVLLRQLVILVSFFGAMMATHRGKHINVDALSKLVPPTGRRALSVVTNALAVGVCVVFARAGAELVAIGREHPSPLMPWADEWAFQLMFPLGFGLLAFHFGVRLLEALTGTAPVVEAPMVDTPSVARKGEA